MDQQQLIASKILDIPALQHKLHLWRFKGYKTVFTNGCFDLLHPGHLHTLATAKDMGDKLIVGLNTDSSVNVLKGSNRPIMDQQARAQLLAALHMVDAVVLFDESTPIDLIKLIMPDVLVKGGDYAVDQIVGAKEVIVNGGKVEVIPFLTGYSTTLIEQKVKG